MALKLRQEYLREALSSAWELDHQAVRAEAGSLDMLYRWFVRANFNYYTTLPGWMNVWRGISAIGPGLASKGVSIVDPQPRHRGLVCHPLLAKVPAGQAAGLEAAGVARGRALLLQRTRRARGARSRMPRSARPAADRWALTQQPES
ncbi:MAG TPA: hypothetical protein VFY87_21075 [Geminicoccaceae bacterium]|nr:hypothetical protein [Geminicoccaceae bacterium]